MTAAVLPSIARYVAAPKLTVTCGSSSSLMLTVVSLGEPSLTPAGRLDPNPSSTLSPSSSTVSWVAENVIVFDVSPGVEGHRGGHPRVVGGHAPPWFVVVIGTSTIRSGSALSVTVTVTVPPSAAV